MSKSAPGLFLLHGIIILAVPVLLVTGSVRVIMTPLWLTLEYTRPGFPPDHYGFSTADRLRYGVYGVEYLLNDEAVDFLGNLRLPLSLCFNPPAEAVDCTMFNELELRHLQDVKQVAQTAFGFGIIMGIAALMAISILWRRARRRLYRALLQGSLVTLAAIATIVVMALTAWDFFFDTFHALFFQAGTWRFYFSDTLIRLYPEPFWFDAALTTGSLTTIGALVLTGLAWWKLSHRVSGT